MTKAILPNKFQIFSAEVQKSINSGLKIFNRLSLGRITKDFYSDVRNQKKMKLMFRHDFTNKYIAEIYGLADIATSNPSVFAESTFKVVYTDGTNAELKGNETISVIERVKDLEAVQKAKPVIKEDIEYTIALVKKTRFGNNQYLKKDGTFSVGYANRYSFKTMKGADNLLMKIVKEGSYPINRLKITSSELAN